MPSIAEIRQQFPQYDDLSDEALAEAFYRKFYSDMPREEFDASIGAKKPKDESDGFLRNIDSAVRGAADIVTFGLADEISGGLSALTGIGGDFGDVSGNIQEERDIQEFRDKNDPIASNAGRLAGGVAMAARGGLLGLPRIAPKSPALGSRIAAGAKEGALYGGLYGAGSGEGMGDRVGDAVAGAATGGMIGGAIPTIVAGARTAAKPLTDAIGARRNPSAYGARKVQERLAASGMSPQQAGTRMERAPGSSLADVSGSSARDLLRTATNIPGPARDRVTKQLTLRQMGQGDRLKAIIRDVFADPDGFITAKDQLSKAWAATGEELYEPALKRKIVWTDRLKQFVDEPIFKRGLAQGVKIQRLESLAAGKPFNPSDYAIVSFNEAGDPIIGAVPNMRTLNVAKKGIDAIIGDMKNPITGRLTEEGRATDMVRRAFLKEIDRWNPDYAKARQTWGGFAKVNEALEFGRKEAFRMSPEAVRKTFAEMSVSEKQAARIGIADAMRDKVDKAGFTNNAVLRIFSNRQNTGVLKEVFPDQESFSAFRKAIFAEARKRATYDAVKGNSTTARQMMDLAESGGLAEGADLAGQVARGDIVGAGMKWLGTRLKMLGGFTPEVADEVAKRLTSSDPGAARRLMSEISKIEKQAISADKKRALIESLVTRSIAAPAVSAISQN